MSALNVRRLEGHIIINFHDVEVPFVDCHDLHDHHIDTFEVPEFADILLNAVAGSYVQLGCGSERFWVRVIHVFAEHDPCSVSFLGTVANELINEEHGLVLDDLVYFKSCNIFKIGDGHEPSILESILTLL